MKKIDNKGQISIEYLLLLGAIIVLLGVVIFVVSNSSQSEKAKGEQLTSELNKSIQDL